MTSHFCCKKLIVNEETGGTSKINYDFTQNASFFKETGLNYICLQKTKFILLCYEFLVISFNFNFLTKTYRSVLKKKKRNVSKKMFSTKMPDYFFTTC